MASFAHSPGDRESRLDEIVLAYLKARETDPNLDQQAWIDRNPELQGELADFFHDQDRIERLAAILHSLTEATQTASDVTIAWDDPAASRAAFHSRSLQTLGDYDLIEKLGKGGMGVVYKARQRSLKRVVALKMILAGSLARAEERLRFRTEAEAVARLQHPNIVQIYEVGEMDGCPFFSLEYVEGGSLAARIDGTPQPPRSAAQLVRILAETMHFAHEQGVIHRDLKPANILLTLPGGPRPGAGKSKDTLSPSTNSWPQASVPKITDFGLAKQLDDDSGQTVGGSILGTPSYMSPEQAAGQTHLVGAVSDVYGLGAVLYELLTGRPPFKAASPFETMKQVERDDPVAPTLLQPKLDRDIETICLKCLQKNPQRRYESAAALADDLQRYLEGRPIKARPILNTVKFWRLCRRHPGTSISLSLVLASLLVLMAVIAGYNRRLREDNRQLQMALTKQVADRIDSDLLQIMRVPTVMATTLSVRSDWNKEQLEPWMLAMLAKDERMFGTAVAYEPFRFGDQEKDFALYAYRPKEGPPTKMLKPPEYKDYRQWDWYQLVKTHKTAQWTEPFFDNGGANIPMITYSVPIWCGKEFVGVATADLSVAYFDAMRSWLDEVKIGNSKYAFVLSPTGTFISHPDSRFQMPKKITELPEFQTEAVTQALAERLLNRKSGSVRAIDPATGVASTFYFAPIQSAQWWFVVVTED
jgi:serine/threonine protein kinase